MGSLTWLILGSTLSLVISVAEPGHPHICVYVLYANIYTHPHKHTWCPRVNSEHFPSSLSFFLLPGVMSGPSGIARPEQLKPRYNTLNVL